MKARILIVEDSEIAASAQKFILLTLGCEVDCVCTGEEGIKIASENKYDLILMDIGLPGINGMQATVKIRASDSEVNNSKTPIVAVTANRNSDEYAKYRESGIDEVICKPFTPDKAKEVLARYYSANAKSA